MTKQTISDKDRYNNNLMFNTKYLIRDVFYLEQLKELQADINQAIMDKEEPCDVCHNITEDYETTEDHQVFCIDCMEEHNG